MSHRYWLYFLFTLGGVSALIYEVTWMRQFRVVFGSSTRSGAVILAVFFAGLAVGYLLGGRLARRRSPVLVYGIAELAVAAGALLVPLWLLLFHAVYPGIYQAVGANPMALTGVRILLAALALAIPTVAMGVTLPVLAHGVVTEADHVARRTGILYALNIAGAVGGALLAGFTLPPAIGVFNTILVAAALNLFCAFIALALHKRSPSASALRASADRSSPQPRAPLLFAAAVSGFGLLALEVVYLRILSQRSESSVYSFTLMLVMFLVFLGLAAGWVALKLDRVHPWRAIAWSQAVAIPLILLSPFLFQFVPLVGFFTPEDALTSRLLKLGIGSALLLGPPIFLAGIVLPATWKIAGHDRDEVGPQVGRLTAVNTLAAVAGSLVAGFVFLPRLGAAGSVLPIALLYAALATVAFALSGITGPKRWIGGAVCLAMVAAWAGLGFWKASFQRLEPGQKLIAYHDGEAATVAVLEAANGHRILKVNHEYTLGSTAAGDREVRQGHLPLLLHPDPKKVAFIGVATGMTASGYEEFPVEKVVAMEIIPGVIDELDQFSRWNRGLAEDEKVELVVADGRNHLLGTSERFDVIVSDLFVPWHAGTGDLYAREHFRTARERLAPGGIFLQWLPGYQLTPEELRCLTATFLEVFPETALWRSDFHVTQPILGLAGYRDGLALDPEAVKAHCARLAESPMPYSRALRDPAGLALHYVAGPEALGEWAAGAPLNTDNRPLIEFGTPASFYTHLQRNTGPVLELMAGFRPRKWAYPDWIAEDEPSPEEVFAIADRLHDSATAVARHNFEKEFQLLSELARDAGELTAVTERVVGAALNYRERNMGHRADKLLEILVTRDDPPMPALLLLAQAKRFDNEDDEAIELFTRIAELSPEAPELLLRPVVEMLMAAERYEDALPHFERIVEARPEDGRLRLEYAKALHETGDAEAAAAEVEAFKSLSLGDERKKLWTYLRTLGLDEYVD